MNSVIPERFLTYLREEKFYKHTLKSFHEKQTNQKYIVPISKNSHYILTFLCIQSKMLFIYKTEYIFFDRIRIIILDSCYALWEKLLYWIFTSCAKLIYYENIISVFFQKFSGF